MINLGQLDREKFEKKTIVSQNEILVSADYYEEVINTGSISVKDAFQKGVKISVKSSIRPEKTFMDEFYEFLLDRYKEYIYNIFVSFSVDFNDEVYGLTPAEQKKVALKHFNEKYKELKVSGFHKVKKDVSPLGIENIGLENRLEYLNMRREGLKRNVSKRDFILEYLYGNLKFFDAELMNNDDWINQFVFFESELKALLSLNDRFSFEVDIYFSKAAKDKKVYDRYKHIFISLKSFLEIHITIQNLSTHVSSNIDCLYHSLNELKLITGKKSNFLEYLKTEHNIKKINIPKIELDFDSPNVQRVDGFLKQFSDLAVINS
ncbi:hypothetical protein ACW5R3_12240 [Bizionia sp. KMM 8389]